MRLAAALPGWEADTLWSDDPWIDLAEVREMFGCASNEEAMLLLRQLDVDLDGEIERLLED